MITREQIIATARTWQGTPTRHQGALKGICADCKGMVVGVCRELGMPEGNSLAANAVGYGHGFSGQRLFDGLRDTLIRVEQAEPADLIAINFGRDPFPRHLAILTQPGWIIHAYFAAKFVAEVPLGAWRVHSSWTWPSLGVAGDG